MKFVINNLLDVKNFFKKFDKKIFWVWVTSFMRIIPAFFLWKNYSIICFKNSLDNKLFEKYTNIICIEDKFKNAKLNKLNSSSIVEFEWVKKILNKNKWSYLFVYKSSKSIDKYSIENNINLIWNSYEKKSLFENKKNFREILNKIWIDPIFWENISYEKFIWLNYNYFFKKYWNKLVLQFPDIDIWWWIWTVFLNNEYEYNDLLFKIKDWFFKNKVIKSINITKFIDWISSSIIWCTTKHWVFTTNIQKQIIDIKEVINLKKWNWLFCWHDWSSSNFSKNVNQKAQYFAKKVWEYMYSIWFKWIFWLDLLVDEKNDDVFIVECNPRFTWVFPMLSMIDIKMWNIPLDVFHILEFLWIDYEIDFKKIDNLYKNKKKWSHIILTNLNNKNIKIKNDILPWVYKFENNKIHFLKEWFLYSDLQNDNEFIIIDWNPSKWTIIKSFSELSRICHFIFWSSILEKWNKLNNKIKNIIKLFYNEYI